MKPSSSTARRVQGRPPRIAIFATDPRSGERRAHWFKVHFVRWTQRRSARLGYFSEHGVMMDDLTNPAELINGAQKAPVIVIIEDRALARTCAANVLKRELAGFEIAEMTTADALNGLSGRDIRLIVFNIGDKPIT